VEHQTADGECLRNDNDYAYVAAWEFVADGRPPQLHKEPLTYEEAHMAQRSYK
jgi:succinate dehydrogenase / fumarate reductase flavoprotein subunit